MLRNSGRQIDCYSVFCLQVSSQEVGHDEFSTQTLARKQREMEEEIQSHRSLIDSLHEQALTLPEAVAQSPQVHKTHIRN